MKVSPGNVDLCNHFLSIPSTQLHTEPSTKREQRYPIKENRGPPERFQT